ncbi:glucans biosynthesis glucosyltransferase H [Marinicauda pacifica]|uniref:glucans biosynthesis glucosyltransferase MdoH n=1 Tax=Marinicauda pacifica TaxID=1133559 RepID=UPI00198346CF|nr:glucans biosynthesis glucosyltransferase MdoH [Marinicauda pacifica]GGE40654.1 glucans biosynthesis glucosyltransferase H [Marinicauda pacifica]
MAEGKRALPPEDPLEMPRGRVHDAFTRAPGWALPRRIELYLARTVLFLASFTLTAYGVYELHAVMNVAGGLTLTQWAFLVLFTISFGWVAFSAVQAVLGFPALLAARRTQAEGPVAKTAILLPVYNEEPARIAVALEVMIGDLARDAPDRFAVFLLADTNRPGAWVEEEAIFSRLISQAPEGCPVYYRRRSDNAEKKAGNIADWVQRWGAGYEAMLVLDADSVMGSGTVMSLARRIAADPQLGLLQTIPRIVRARTLFGRLQQFANRCYGPVFAAGLNVWHGREANYWGHNAIIRTQAFAAAARLPILTGKPPFGGPVMSHDFIEAALIRRAGWRVELALDLTESYEEAPPALSDVIIRDRRWCQGNMQHARFLFARGLSLVSRIHIVMGMMSYISALVWLALIATGLVLAVQAELSEPDYFAEPGLFPTWPVFDSERAVQLFIIAMAVVLVPKVLGWLSILVRPRHMMRYGGPVALTASVLVETLMSALYAPVMMLAQANIILDIVLGRDSGWRPQRRDGGAIAFTAAVRAHAWHFITGLVLASVTLGISPGLFWWTSPVTAGLLLSPILSWISGMRAIGSGLSAAAILRTPEERPRRAPVMDAMQERLGIWRDAGGADSLPMLVADRGLLAFHCAQLTDPAPGRYVEAEILAAEKIRRSRNLDELSDWLTATEQMAVLNNRDLLMLAAQLGEKPA